MKIPALAPLVRQLHESVGVSPSDEIGSFVVRGEFIWERPSNAPYPYEGPVHLLRGIKNGMEPICRRESVRDMELHLQGMLQGLSLKS